jgi:hypothetical protein
MLLLRKTTGCLGVRKQKMIYARLSVFGGGFFPSEQGFEIDEHFK